MNNEISTLQAQPETAVISPERETLVSFKEIGSRLEQHLSIIEHDVATVAPSSVTVRPPNGELSQIPPGVPSRASTPHVRNGKIARLPKLERDMVNRMLHNHVSYAEIADALSELGIEATERNVSNWKTRGGYREWCAEQDRQIHLSRIQDNLSDYLRKNDATQLPEVGLQVAATQLSSMLLQPETSRELAADPKKYSCIVGMLCQLSTQIATLQKDRDETYCKASIRGTLDHYKREEEKTVERMRRACTSALTEGPNDEEIPHRNDLPERDHFPYREPGKPSPGIEAILQQFQRAAQPVPTK